MRSIILSGLMSLAVLGTLLTTESTANAQPRRGGYSAGVYYGPRGAGAYYGPNYYYGSRYNDGRYYGSRYNDGRYYGNRYYGNRYYDGYYYGSGYYYPRSSYYYGGGSGRYSYYTSNGWRISWDRRSGAYWYYDNGYWYRWY